MPNRRAHLKSLLDEFSPAGARERTFHERMLALLDGPVDPFARDHYAPGHFTASSFVVDRDHRLLLILHAKLGRWLQPGGHVDPSDTDILAAARRELREEVGLSAPPLHTAAPGIFDIDIHPIPARKAEPEHEHYDVRFCFSVESGHAVAGSDALEARWVPLGEVGGIESDASVMRAVGKLELLS